MDKTPFAGLTRLDPDDTLSEDNSSFQAVNPIVTDRLLRRALTHEHTGAAGLADPTAPATLVALTDQGVIPADTTVMFTYTFVDELGGETMPAPAATISTAVPLDPTDDEPSVVLDTTAGSLGIGSYSYAVAFTDGTGGETPIGPVVTVDRDPGPANARMIVTGLSNIVAGNPSATGWRLYRSRDGDEFYLLAEGSAGMDSVADDGTLCVDCTDTPVLDDANTTMGTNGIMLTVPAIPDGVTLVRIYGSTADVFATPALLSELPPAMAVAAQTYLTLDFQNGQPPDASQSLPQPSKIDAETQIENLYWRTPVASLAALPTADNVTGDSRLTLDTRTLYVWDGDSWEPITGGAGGGTGGGTGGTTEPTAIDPTPIAYEGLWGDYGDPFGPGVVYQESTGLAILQGVVMRSSGVPAVGERIGTIPEAVWPEGNLAFEVNAGGTRGRIDITANGYILWSDGGTAFNAYVALSGITWVPATGLFASAAGTGGGGGGGTGAGLGAREDVTVVTGSLVTFANEQGTVAAPVGYKLLRAVASGPSRLRLYGDQATRDADLTRDVNTPPSGDHGVMLDMLFTGGDLEQWMTPPVDGYNRDGLDALWWTVANNGAEGAVTVTLTLVRTEALA